MTIFFLFWVLGQSISVLLVWRFAWQLGRQVDLTEAPHVVIIVAVKGRAPCFEEFLDILLSQDYPNYRVIFSVETDCDPALPSIELRRNTDPNRIQVIIAGLSVDEGQKVTNLRAAVAATSADDDILILADADILPKRDWLRRLVEPLERRESDVVTAYPWIVAQDCRLSTFVLASIFAGIAILPRPQFLNAASGSSIALRRAKFEAWGIADAWRGATSDDLQLTRVVKRFEGSIVTPHELLLRTPTTTKGFVDVIHQGQRWYMLLRIYLPRLYALAAAGATVIAAGWLGATIASIAGYSDAVVTLALGFCLAVLRTCAYAVIVMRLWGANGLLDNRWFLLMNSLVTPLATIVNAVLVWSSLLRHQTAWAGTVYEVRGAEKTIVLSRTLL